VGLRIGLIRWNKYASSVQRSPSNRATGIVCPVDTVLESAMVGSSVWDGTLSIDEFRASAKALVSKWEQIEVDDSLPDWAWRPCCRMGVPSEVVRNGLDLLLSLFIIHVMFFFLSQYS
jgi:hypothetical protein